MNRCGQLLPRASRPEQRQCDYWQHVLRGSQAPAHPNFAQHGRGQPLHPKQHLSQLPRIVTRSAPALSLLSRSLPARPSLLPPGFPGGKVIALNLSETTSLNASNIFHTHISQNAGAVLGTEARAVAAWTTLPATLSFDLGSQLLFVPSDAALVCTAVVFATLACTRAPAVLCSISWNATDPFVFQATVVAVAPGAGSCTGEARLAVL